MPRITLATVTLPAASGLAKDGVTNNFVLESPDDWPPSVDLGEVTMPLANFYNHVQATGSAVGHYISRGISRVANGVVMKLYDITDDLGGTPHGSPFATDATTLIAAGHPVPDYPAEVACCLTLRAISWDEQPVERPDGPDAGTEDDRPRQRHTGRLYIGPLEAAAGTNGSDGHVRPSPDLQTTLLDAAEYLAGELAVNGHFLQVWSRKDASVRIVTDVQVDNAFDVQRRRGIAPTVRQTRTFV